MRSSLNNTIRRSIAAVGSVLVVGILAAGCSSSSPPQGGDAAPGERLAGSFTELVQQYLEKEKNPFVIEVLTKATKTGKITQAQYDEAHRNYTECMTNAGYVEAQKRLASGIIQLTPPSNLKDGSDFDKYATTAVSCSDELAPIEALYRAQQGNPDLLANNDEVVVQCLKKNGLVKASYSTRDLRAEFDSQFKNARFDPRDTAAQECFSAGSMAVELGDE